MNEFTHYTGCKGNDNDNCSACALLNADRRGPNYAGWPLAFIASGRRIPQRYFDALIVETERKDNPAYTENLNKKLKEHGYNIDIIKNSRR
jgi:hypothetical protein